MHHRKCIDRDIGYGCHEEDVMLWRGLGGRLGVDLARRFTAVGGGIFGKQFGVSNRNRCRSREEGDAPSRVH